MNAVTAAAKKTLRTTLRARRREIVAHLDHAAQSRALADEVMALVEQVCGDTPSRIPLYESTPVEPPTEDLVEALTAAGHQVVMPVTLPDLSLDWADLHGQVLGTDAIDACPLVLTPGLAVDRHGTRLGQGGGCYDKALAHVHADAVIATLLHPGELTDMDLPREAHDHAVDAVVSSAGTHWFSRRPRFSPPAPQ